jgi:hypothetical protein
LPDGVEFPWLSCCPGMPGASGKRVDIWNCGSCLGSRSDVCFRSDTKPVAFLSERRRRRTSDNTEHQSRRHSREELSKYHVRLCVCLGRSNWVICTSRPTCNCSEMPAHRRERCRRMGSLPVLTAKLRTSNGSRANVRGGTLALARFGSRVPLPANEAKRLQSVPPSSGGHPGLSLNNIRLAVKSVGKRLDNALSLELLQRMEVVHSKRQRATAALPVPLKTSAAICYGSVACLRPR